MLPPDEDGWVEITVPEIITLLRAEIAAAGSQAAWARQHHVSPTVISQFLRGRFDPPPSILEPLNIRRTVAYYRRVG